MSFQYKVFPELRLKHGIEKTINDPVSITTNGNREIRRKVNKTERYSWTIPGRNLYQSDMEAIVNFFNEVGSSVTSFLYRDPTMPELVNVQCKPVQINGDYAFALYHSGMHPVINLNDNSSFPQWDLWENTGIVVKRNGVAMSYGNDFSAYVNYPVSSITNYSSYPTTTLFASATGTPWSPSDIITFSGPIYKTVRFDSMISYKVTGMTKSTLLTGACEVVPTVSEMADIKLIEVFEYAA